ncbi:tRNA isopentenyl-2-thiomethyl-A-37 hydroxylase MiaE [Colwellia polaris]|nr:tRNA isopentenyl-2-thiomethyl-A-37 hydroxylase MiaE [Colwellia polaris]
MPYSKLLAPINNFLKVPTPASWLEEAKAEKNLPVLLIDHLICEQTC